MSSLPAVASHARTVPCTRTPALYANARVTRLTEAATLVPALYVADARSSPVSSRSDGQTESPIQEGSERGGNGAGRGPLCTGDGSPDGDELHPLRVRVRPGPPAER